MRDALTPLVQTSTARRVLACAVAVSLLCAGCAAVGPDYRVPPSTLDSGFIGSGAVVLNTQPMGADIATFWRGFNDPALDALVERALQANGDVRIAQARLQETNAARSEIDASSLPQIDLQAGASRSIAPPTSGFDLTRSQRTGSAYNLGFVANWELDFFGRERRAKESAAAQVSASEAGVGAAQTSVVAEVVRNYLELRGLQRRLELTRAALLNQRASQDIAQARVDAGRGTQLDLERARTLTANTEAALPSLQASIDLTIYRLATLSAQPPAALRERLIVPAALPNLPVTDLASLPVGTPAQWMARRPDVAVAERRLAASTADVGLTQADLYPTISINGLLGFASSRLSDLGNSQSQSFANGIAFSWSVLDFGRIRARVAASQSRALGNLATYEQTLAIALEETEGAFAQFSRSAQRRDSLMRAEASASEAARLAGLRYDAGVSDFLAVLDAEREALSARDALAQADVAQATSLVAVYRSLGGGWTAPR